jgi:hypothetical protein
VTRRQQGYSAAMIVEESRILEVSIFDTLDKNGFHIDFNLLMPDVMVIADEVDFQLMQAMSSYIGESKSVEDHGSPRAAALSCNRELASPPRDHANAETEIQDSIDGAKKTSRWDMKSQLL